MMKEKINIAEILKGCPSGMELDCTICDNVYFDEVTPDMIRCYIKNDTENNKISFHKDGSYLPYNKAKCVIFPKGKTTWEGFVPPCKFKDGDVVADIEGAVIIYKGITTSGYCGSFVSLDHYNKFIPYYKSYLNYIRLATEKEKQKLFKAIKDNGYKWNSETKTLEKLVEPKFKDGDIIFTHADCTRIGLGNTWISIFEENRNGGVDTYVDYCNEGKDFYTYLDDKGLLCLNEDIIQQRLATEAEKVILFQAIRANGFNWNPESKTLNKLIEPKFKVGDRVKEKKSYISGTITDIDDDSYKVEYKSGGISFFSIKFQNDLELVPNHKFKVGDKITYRNIVYTIVGIDGDYYSVKSIIGEIGLLPIFSENAYELVPKKFDITTLKPFESKVLVRDVNGDNWIGAFYSHYKSELFYVIGNVYYYQCIPYEGNEHLLNTNDDCDDFYKNW